VFTLEGPDLALLGAERGPCSSYSGSGPAGPLCVEPLTGDSGAPQRPLNLALALGAVAVLGAGLAIGLGLGRKRRDLGRIKGLFEDRLTPKRKAQEMILSQLNMLEEGYWVQDEKDAGMTAREVDQVSAQITRQRDRVAKLFKYDPWS
jgi:hypothetical protein